MMLNNLIQLFATTWDSYLQKLESVNCSNRIQLFATMWVLNKQMNLFVRAYKLLYKNNFFFQNNVGIHIIELIYSVIILFALYLAKHPLLLK